VLANLYFHYAVVVWLGKEFPEVPFAIYADDMVAHTKTQAQAHRVMEGLNKRLQQCGLSLHPEKTKIVYCKDSKRRLESEHIAFDFLGYTFRPRKSKTKQGKLFINFSPAISNKAATRIRQTLRKWKIQQRSDKSIEDLANMLNPLIRGWINYYGKFYKSALYPIFKQLNQRLGKWAMRKFKSCKKSSKKGHLLVARVAQQDPKLFAHWKFGIIPTAEQ
jgi:RNA-directed DNA polymerase